MPTSPPVTRRWSRALASALVALLVAAVFPLTSTVQAGAAEGDPPRPPGVHPNAEYIPSTLEIHVIREQTDVVNGRAWGRCGVYPAIVFSGEGLAEPGAPRVGVMVHGAWGGTSTARHTGAASRTIEFYGYREVRTWGHGNYALAADHWNQYGYIEPDQWGGGTNCAPSDTDRIVETLRHRWEGWQLWSIPTADGRPTPECTIDSQFGPGGSEIGFGSSVANEDGDGYLQEWTFSDGTTAAANLVNKVAGEPGDFSGTFRIWRIDGTLDKSVTCTAEVAAPSLGVSIGFPTRDVPTGIPDLTFEVGETVPIQLKVRATDDGVGDLSDITFLDEPLRVAPEGAVSLVSGPTPAIEEPLALAPGDEVVYDAEIRVEQPGPFTLLSAAQGLDAIGRTVGPVEADRTGRGGALEVEATVDPEEVDLEEAEDGSGPVPQDVEVTVEVTNPLTVPIEDATLSVLEPLLDTTTAPPADHRAFSYLVDPPPPADGEGSGDGDTPSTDPVQGVPEDIDLGTLPAAVEGVDPEPVVEELAGRALDAGSVDLRFIVRGTADGRPVTGTATVRLEVRTEVDFAFDAEVDEGTVGSGPGDGAWVTGGGSWEIDGTFENRSLDKTLQVLVMPLLERNAAYGVPVPDDMPIPDEECGLGSAQILEPGEEVRWTAPVRTVLDGATRSVVRYVPQVFEVLDDGTKVPVDPERVLVTPGSDEHQVSVDTRDRVPDFDASAGEVLWAYGQGTLDAIGETFYGLGAMGYEIGAFALQPWEWPAAYDAAGIKVAEFVHTVYENLSPADKAAWNDSWVSAVAFATGMALDEARQLVDTMALQSFTELETAWRTGDHVSVARWWGEQTGANIDTVLGGLTKAVGVCKLISSKTPWARAALLEKQRKVAAEVAELGARATASNIPTGAALTRELRRGIWGIDDVMYAKVQAFVDEFGIVIGVRRRGPGSIDKIEAGTHYPKAYHNKAKNIAAGADTDYLGFLDDLDTSAIKEPPLLQDLEAQFLARGTPPDVQAKVRARHKTRMKEWYGPGVDLNTGLGGDFTKSERYKWAVYANEGFPVPKEGAPLDYSDNVRAGRSVPPDSEITVRVPARIRTYVGTDGRPQMVLEIDRGQGWKPMTGDMDPLVVAKADFSALPEAKRIEFYERAHELGFEHVESATWENPGRNEYIEEFSERVPGSEAMFTWIPKSVPRATRFDPQMGWNRVDDATLEAAAIYLRGSTVVLRSPDPGSGGPIPDDDPGAGYISPKTIFLVDPDCGGGGPESTGPSASALEASPQAEGQCSIEFDRGPDAIVLRQTLLGDLERWTAEDGWQPFVVEVAGRIPVLPQSVTTEGVGAGATEVEIASAADLDLVAGLDEWFAVGDLVVIDPGGPNEQYAVIGGFGSLIFTEPLEEAIPPGTLISVVDPLGDPTDPRDPNGPPVVDDPDDPDPVDPGPVDPGPVDPDPVDPGPVDPGVGEPPAGSGAGGVSGAGGAGAGTTPATAVPSTGTLPYTGAGGTTSTVATLGLALLGAGVVLALAARGQRRTPGGRRR